MSLRFILISWRWSLSIPPKIIRKLELSAFFREGRKIRNGTKNEKVDKQIEICEIFSTSSLRNFDISNFESYGLV